MAQRLTLPDNSVALVFSYGNRDNVLGSMAANVDDSDDSGKLIALGKGIMSEVGANLPFYVEAGLQELRKTNSVLDKALSERDNMKELMADVKGHA
jgi:hypothetical protein